MKSNLHFNFFISLMILATGLQAQVPVFEEPHHKVVLLNKYVRLIDVHVPPHDTTLYHKHSNASAIVFITKNATGSQMMDGEPSTGQAIPGNTFYAPYDDKPIVHRVWNDDSVVYHVMDIEMINTDDTVSCPAIDQQNIKLNWDEKKGRMYSISLPGGGNCNIDSSNCQHLLILISGTAFITYGNATRQMKPGNFLWIPSGKSFHIKGHHLLSTNLALLELK